MSATKARLLNEMKEAMKSGAKERLGVIRMLITEVKNAEINDLANPGRERTEAEVLAILAAYHKMLTKTLSEYPPDRQEPLKAELKIVEEYLPKQLSVAEAKAEILGELKGMNERQFGPLMKHFQPQFSGRADGRVISEALKAALAEV